ncbi:MAG: rRNA methyltransferase [Deltaproteobacteria bacterium]|nr:MAG: rRNA methyltransferase [Deltaproteobacteria bacterium]
MTYRPKDSYHRRARAAGYRARSAYKLIELADRFRLLRRGDHVVDLGAWPGGWLQVAVERIGADGRAVGVDVVPIDPLPAANVDSMSGDVRDPAVVRAVRERLGRAADLVLSDLAPKLTGVAATDAARQSELGTAVLAALPDLLRPHGRLVMKVFMGPDQPALLARLQTLFDEVRTTRAEATRRGSAELYAVCTGYRGQPQ